MINTKKIRLFALLISGLAFWTTSAMASQKYQKRCPGVPYCKDMKSCNEAYSYLTKCPSLDGDKDGIPCENICSDSSLIRKNSKVSR